LIRLPSRDLDLLKRDRKLQKRYEAWAVEITSRHGSMGQHIRLKETGRNTLTILSS